MDETGTDEQSLSQYVEQLQRERDELRKDIEQLCMQQAGPGYLAVATKMHFQRTASLEQEIENLKNKLSRCSREKRNLQEELSEAYQIKTQLANLHATELQKSKEAEKQVKFFQSCVAAAFSERDSALIELEKAKEQEEAMSQKVVPLEERIEELESLLDEQNQLNSSLQIELETFKQHSECLEKVVNKFYDIRERDTGLSSESSLLDKYACILNDPSENWIFSTNNMTPKSKYISSLEEEKAALKNSIGKLQKNLRMGLEIEQHLRESLRSLEKRQEALVLVVSDGVSALRTFHAEQRVEVINMLEEESSVMREMIVKIQNKLSEDKMNHENLTIEFQKESENNDVDYRDVHVASDANPGIIDERRDLPASSNANSTADKTSNDLQQALSEKVAALLLLSQEEERLLLETEVNQALQNKIEELQRNLSQVASEKVLALVELAELKREYQTLKESSSNSRKQKSFLLDPETSVSAPEQEGKLKNLFKKTYLKRWMLKDQDKQQTDGTKGNEVSQVNSTFYSSMDIASLHIENAALKESLSNLEHLTSSIHRLRSLLLQVQVDALTVGVTDGVIGTLENIVAEAGHVKTALCSSLPVSWSGDESDPNSHCSPGEQPENLEASSTEKINAVASAGLEMVELLLLAAELQKNKLLAKCINL